MDREGRAGEQARSARGALRRQVAPSGQNGRRPRLDVLRAPIGGRFIGPKGDPGAKISAAACLERRCGICGKADRRPKGSRELANAICHDWMSAKLFTGDILIYFLRLFQKALSASKMTIGTSKHAEKVTALSSARGPRIVFNTRANACA